MIPSLNEPSKSINGCVYEYSWMRHVLGLDEGVEFFGAYEAELDGGFAEADVGVMGGFGNLGRGVVADFGCERGD